ncbi:MAG: DEAD/DEAH box helicase [Microthrixaceae bacterium]
MPVATPDQALSLIAPGAQVVVRDEEWLVRAIEPTTADGVKVRCVGTSTLVRDAEATFLTKLDNIEPLRPEETTLIADDSPQFRASRLYLEAVLRKTPVPANETGLALADRHLLNRLDFQRRAAHKAIDGLRPRLLIADAVGLGKTLEVGLILAELIRRGRGERILVVTPRHILEQFQHELWCRFAIPLVRLDSEGIARVRREIPANRNPFSHYKRAIISIDTLKNAGRYRHHLEGIHWDAVVIDECHNLVNRGTLNNQLARVLAPRTEALLLTSATPHNGDPESFAELIRLLDPTAIADPHAIDADAIDHLYVRRHKAHEEVAAEVRADWEDRLEPRPLLIDASPAENALFAELADTWIYPASGTAPTSGKGRTLFPWTLFKAALSSHRALGQTVAARRKTLADRADAQSPESRAEDAALVRLDELVAAIEGNATEEPADEVNGASKLQALIEQLVDIGVGPRSATRVVVFSERIATLDWLAEVVPAALKLKDKHVQVLHGGMADVKQMDVIEDFGQVRSDVRLLLTGDMASEGVNLHRQCHHLIHFDLPWSLITIEQRNGRIDRYGQTHAPDVRALLLNPDHPALHGDVRIFTKLLQREHEAHRAFGDAGSLLGVHDVALEEEAVMRALSAGADPDEAIPAEPKEAFDMMAILSGATGSGAVPTHVPPSLFDSDAAFFDEALHVAFDDATAALDLRRDDGDPTFLSLVPPKDLMGRMRALPRTFLAEQHIVDRLKLTGNDTLANSALEKARETTDSGWPEVGFLSPLHPFGDWLVDKVLASVGRNEAPVIVAEVDAPVFCVQAMFSNGRGHPQLVEWMAVTEHFGSPVIADMFEALMRANVNADMANPGATVDLPALQQRLPGVIESVRAELAVRRAAYEARLAETLAKPSERLDAWQVRSEALAMDLVEHRRRERRKAIEAVRSDTAKLIESMHIEGDPLVRVLAVLVGPTHR